MRFFNTTGPCNPTDHYMLPATARLEGFDIDRLLAQKSYFVLHAPRQTGKTTAMLELACQLTAAGAFIGVLVSMEVGAAFPDDIGLAEDAILAIGDSVFGFNYPMPTIRRCGKRMHRLVSALVTFWQNGLWLRLARWLL